MSQSQFDTMDEMRRKLEFKIKMTKEDERIRESTRERRCIISHDNIFKFYWDLWVIILAIYNAIALPLLVAFAEV